MFKMHEIHNQNIDQNHISTVVKHVFIWDNSTGNTVQSSAVCRLGTVDQYCIYPLKL